MGATVNALTIGWEVGIGLSAVLSAYFLTSNRTKDWSVKKIVTVSSMCSLIITLILIKLFVYRGG